MKDFPENPYDWKLPLADPDDQTQPAGKSHAREKLRSLARDELAKFVTERQDDIRRVARTKLVQVARSLFDSEDVFASVARELDEMASSGAVRPENERELWALIATMTRNNAVSKVRFAARAQALIAEDGEYSRQLAMRAEHCANDGDVAVLCLRLLASLESSDDRKFFALRMRGASHRVIAGVLDITEDACRQRWMLIRRKLSQTFTEADHARRQTGQPHR